MIHTDNKNMININRLKSRMLEMAQIGKTAKGGVTRLALSEEDKEARKLFIQWMQELGMETRVDDVGNIYGRLEGKDRQAPVVMTGSHLDTVPKGGKFDGVLGVLAALEAMETIRERGIEHTHPIEIVSFTNEEGARFAPQMLGSGVVTGKFSKEYVYEREDADGFHFKNELQKIGFLGEEKDRARHIAAFLELHIEQGPILEAENLSIGIVEGVAGFSWMEVKLSGQSDHSGSTPMTMRKDSLVAASAIIQEISKWAANKKDGTVATVGRIRTTPGIINAVPGQTIFSVDIRHPEADQLDQYKEELKQFIQDMAAKEAIDCSINEIGSNRPVRFSSNIIHVLNDICQEDQLPYKRMISGAGHDAMYINQIADTAMLFVPSVNGKSHCEEEATSWKDIEKGVSVLYKALCRLASE
ncbi:hydantoinase/carbamoylase family amidase [Bacillus aerolatus]|uniref:Hydantoinase/carbamoylase family amidase n=1 Tax=Bacillus aerolatus TaxID=2653354 RepID=A0A6I1FLX2_9BACI|nr:Zn-dependent hydrolase [Bacillus aerolatus]KAB7707349.1 hydantoinase/carbamoylase family amidase [Bacillus aerolatus]